MEERQRRSFMGDYKRQGGDHWRGTVGQACTPKMMFTMRWTY